MKWKELGKRLASFGIDSASSRTAGWLVSKFGPHRVLGKVGLVMLAIAAALPLAAWATGHYQTIAICLGIMAGCVAAVCLVLNWVIASLVEHTVKTVVTKTADYVQGTILRPAPAKEVTQQPEPRNAEPNDTGKLTSEDGIDQQ